jgi:hypothetical protein
MNTITEDGAAIIAAHIIEKVKGDFSVPPKWLKLNQAVRYSNIGRDRLIQLAREKKIDGFQDPDLATRPWIFDAESLDRYRRAQLLEGGTDDADDFALDLMGKISH